MRFSHGRIPLGIGGSLVSFIPLYCAQAEERRGVRLCEGKGGVVLAFSPALKL